MRRSRERTVVKKEMDEGRDVGRTKKMRFRRDMFVCLYSLWGQGFGGQGTVEFPRYSGVSKGWGVGAKVGL